MTQFDAPTTSALSADEILQQLESGTISDGLSRVLLGSLKNIIVTRARAIVAQGVEEASYWPQMFYGTSDWLRIYKPNPYNWTLRRVDPAKEDGAIGAALVFTDGHPDHPDCPEFRLVTLCCHAYWDFIRPYNYVKQVSRLNLDKPEHLRLIWDITHKDL